MESSEDGKREFSDIERGFSVYRFGSFFLGDELEGFKTSSKLKECLVMGFSPLESRDLFSISLGDSEGTNIPGFEGKVFSLRD